MYALLKHDFEFLSQFMAQCKYYRKIHSQLQLFESKCETVV